MGRLSGSTATSPLITERKGHKLTASTQRGYPPLVRALLRPQAYVPDSVRPQAIELVETHISYLFLTGLHVYKVKKPVDFGFLDFTTLV